IVQTCDFFTPILDDPYEFGQVAAANSLSDVYAMGGKPLIAMNIVCYPCSLGMEALREILRGGAEKVWESGALLVGGHSVDDREPKYGLSVTGIVHPDRVVLNRGALPGDAIVLTKPLGTGIVSTALMADLADSQAQRRLYQVMSALNDKASQAMLEVGAHACTDITGFGFLGHLMEMAEASGVSLEVHAGQIPVIEGALEYAQMGLIPGGLRRNQDFLAGKVEATDVDQSVLEVMFDPQTSGGLLIAVAPDRADDLVGRLRAAAVDANGEHDRDAAVSLTASVVGRAVSAGSEGPRVRVVR
ncbi:MAG TPA: selenide, water dikinase SelD, partial [Bacillota bacterium]|nr:selenide, water dikinase SelD [Bacillota bacterium]